MLGFDDITALTFVTTLSSLLVERRDPAPYNTNRREVKLLPGTKREKSILKTPTEATNRRIKITEAFFSLHQEVSPPRSFQFLVKVKMKNENKEEL